MADPILVTGPEHLPVTLQDAKQHLRIEHDDDDDYISFLIGAATDHLDGYTGLLGRCVVDQVWKQSFPSFGQVFCLRLGDVRQVEEISYFDADNNLQSLSLADVTLLRQAGRDYVRLAGSLPSAYQRPDAVSIRYRAGWAVSDVPAALQHAILLLVGHFYENREAVSMAMNVTTLPLGVDRLIAPYRYVRIG